MIFLQLTSQISTDSFLYSKANFRLKNKTELPAKADKKKARILQVKPSVASGLPCWSTALPAPCVFLALFTEHLELLNGRHIFSIILLPLIKGMAVSQTSMTFYFIFLTELVLVRLNSEAWIADTKLTWLKCVHPAQLLQRNATIWNCGFVVTRTLLTSCLIFI